MVYANASSRANMVGSASARLDADIGRIIMKKYLTLTAFIFAGSAFTADVYVNPYVTQNGTYIEGHYRTTPDSTPMNNYSTQGNVNPYTGQAGTVNPYAQPQ